jgi:hypothetical protein
VPPGSANAAPAGVFLLVRVGMLHQVGSNFGFRVSGSGFRVSGFGIRVSGSGFQVSGFGFRISGQGAGFRV